MIETAWTRVLHVPMLDEVLQVEFACFRRNRANVETMTTITWPWHTGESLKTQPSGCFCFCLCRTFHESQFITAQSDLGCSREPSLRHRKAYEVATPVGRDLGRGLAGSCAVSFVVLAPTMYTPCPSISNTNDLVDTLRWRSFVHLSLYGNSSGLPKMERISRCPNTYMQ